MQQGAICVHRNELCVKWEKSRMGWLKCNVDVGFFRVPVLYVQVVVLEIAKHEFGRLNIKFWD